MYSIACPFGNLPTVCVCCHYKMNGTNYSYKVGDIRKKKKVVLSGIRVDSPVTHAINFVCRVRV